MLDNCEASNAKILESLNTTLHTLNTTGLSPQHVEWLKGNTTGNFTSGLQKCDLETFLTDVRVHLDSFISMLITLLLFSLRVFSIHDHWHFGTEYNKGYFSPKGF